MNRRERRAAKRGHEVVSVMFGDADPDCELCRELGLVGPERKGVSPSTAPAGPPSPPLRPESS